VTSFFWSRIDSSVDDGSERMRVFRTRPLCSSACAGTVGIGPNPLGHGTRSQRPIARHLLTFILGDAKTFSSELSTDARAVREECRRSVVRVQEEPSMYGETGSAEAPAPTGQPYGPRRALPRRRRSPRGGEVYIGNRSGQRSVDWGLHEP
jgi:hypothetical protein